VRFAGLVAGRPVLVIDQGGGLVSSFEPVVTGLRTGATVRRGGFVGAVAIGRGHCFPGTCLHWGVRRNGVYIDPLDLVAGRIGPPVLLPVLSAEAR
jgi:murein DD-endopeptidase MepM/ murein hydrolase activator NlpD